MVNIEKYDFPVKQKQISDVAAALFQKHGYKRISIEEICKKANVSKMTFYKYYKNKNELIKFLWELWFEKGFNKFDEIADRNIPFTMKLKLLLKLKEETVLEVSHELAKDYFNAVPELEAFFKYMQQKSFKRIIRFIQNEQKKGNVRSDMKAEFFLAIIAKLSELVENDQLVRMYPHYSDFIMEINNFIFYGITNIQTSDN